MCSAEVDGGSSRAFVATAGVVSGGGMKLLPRDGLPNVAPCSVSQASLLYDPSDMLLSVESVSCVFLIPARLSTLLNIPTACSFADWLSIGWREELSVSMMVVSGDGLVDTGDTDI